MASTAESDTKKRRRISKESKVYIDGFLDTHMTRPSQQEIKDLLAKIHEVPEDSWYPLHLLRGRIHARYSTSDTLSEKAISQLEVLSSVQTTIPDPALIKIWASVTKCSPEAVLAWITAKLRPKDLIGDSSTGHLPTPATSISPEPDSVKSESPVVVTSALPVTKTDPVIVQALREAIHEAKQPLSGDGPRPQTLAEFLALFDPYEKKMISLLNILKD